MSEDFLIENSILKTYTGKENSVKIPDGVSVIAGGAFKKNKELLSVSFPEGLTEIGYEAFLGCSHLSEVVFPSSLERIASSAFRACNSLRKLDFPDKLKLIGKAAFCYCSSLMEITIKNRNAEIKEEAFAECSALENICISEGVKINDTAFRGCHNLSDSNGFVIINGALFDYCGCESDVTVPQGVKKICQFAFSKSSVKTIRFPSCVTRIEDFAFYECRRLHRIEFTEDVSYIGEGTFMNCSKLTEISLPQTLRVISRRTFFGCHNLSEVTMGNNVEMIGGYAFYGCELLKTINLSEHLERIGESAFAFCRKLTEIDLPGSVADIAREAFLTCTLLQNITIKNSSTTIGFKAFQGCSESVRITAPRGSIAEAYAYENKIRFFALDSSEAVLPGSYDVFESPDGISLNNIYMCIICHYSCVARSDNGVDDSSESCCYCRIPVKYKIMSDGKIIGILYKEHQFLFADRATHHITVVTDDKYVEGYGDIREEYSYEIFPGNPPVEDDKLSLLVD